MELIIVEKNGHKRSAKEVCCVKCHKKWLIGQSKKHAGLCRACWQIGKNEKFVELQGIKLRARSQTCSECLKEYLIINSAKERKRCKECHMDYTHKLRRGTNPHNKGVSNPNCKSYSKEYKSQQAKEKLKSKRKHVITIKGNKCSRCGEENLPIAAYELHHRNPKEKDRKSMRGSLEKILNEAEKCDLVCANCHKIIHSQFGDERLI